MFNKHYCKYTPWGAVIVTGSFNQTQYRSCTKCGKVECRDVIQYRNIEAVDLAKVNAELQQATITVLIPHEEKTSPTRYIVRGKDAN